MTTNAQLAIVLSRLLEERARDDAEEQKLLLRGFRNEWHLHFSDKE